MDKVDFWGLERSIQERFVASTEGAAAPAPLAIRPLESDLRRLPYLAIGLSGIIGAIVTLRVGFGDLNSRYALAPTWFLALYAGFFTLAALGVLKAVARHLGARAVPYRPAVYLFPVGVIDARTPVFGVHRIAPPSEVSFEVARQRLRVEIDGAKFDFPSSDRERAELAKAALVELRERFSATPPVPAANSRSSVRPQALIDPLLDNGFKNPFSPEESLQKALPFWVKAWPLVALVLGVLLGGAAFLIRNHESEARLYAKARATGSTESYRAYLARGGSNADVETLLLPRAELRDAVKQGNVAALEQFAQAHANSKIKPEIDLALEQALLKELSAAEARGTLDALKAFSAKYASYPFLATHVARAVDARVKSAVDRLKPQLANPSKQLPFIERLLRYTSQHGPQLSLRFQRKPTETLETAEKALRRNAYFSGESSLPSRYFDDAHQSPRETATAQLIISEFNRHFPPDLLLAKLGPPVGANAEPKLTAPTLLITYHTEMSGAFNSRKPRFALAGIGVICKASLEIPGDPEPQIFKLTVWRAPDLKAVTDASTPADLYETMANEAFKRFVKKYVSTWFGEQ